MLLSAHYVFRVPTEYDLMWQITTAAACGSRGIVWFRFYDRPFGPNYHGSPIDEYGNRTEAYYRLLRCQRRFGDHYGELLMRLHHRSTAMYPYGRGGYPAFTPEFHPVLRDVKATTEALFSIFTDDDGNEYLCLVNASQTEPGVFKLFFDREIWRLDELTFNGAGVSEYGYANTDLHWDGLWLYPGQMSILRIGRR